MRRRKKKTIILGTGLLATELASEIINRSSSKYSLVGFISEMGNTVSPDERYSYLGSMRDLPAILESQKPAHIIVAPDPTFDHLPMDRLVESQIRCDVSVETGVQAYERLTGKLAIEALTPGAILFASDFDPSAFMQVFSRITSLLAAGLGLVVLLPFMALIALAVRLDSPGPVFFIQERIGRWGRRFRLLKFRSMRLSEEQHTEWAADNVERITRLGKWLRRFRLDELPQLINVLRGDMNLIGPRPHPSSNHELFTLVSRNAQQGGEQIPYYSLRLSIRPGITGWAQVRYKYANGIDEEMEKLRYDLYYIKHCTPLMDLLILYQTMKVVLFGHSKVQGQQGTGPASTVNDEAVSNMAASGINPSITDPIGEQVPGSEHSLVKTGSRKRYPYMTAARPELGSDDHNNRA